MQRSSLWKGNRLFSKGLATILCLSLALPFPVLAAPGDVTRTPVTPMELPIEVEIELSPAGSLKQAPLWKEMIQLLENPYGPDGLPGTADDGTITRRPSFTATPLPTLNVFPLDYNFLTGQPMRLRTNDGEVSWDQPGPLFDPAEPVQLDAFNTPTALRTPVGALIASNDNVLDEGEENGTTPCVAGVAGATCGYLLVSNPDSNLAIPPDGTIVAPPLSAVSCRNLFPARRRLRTSPSSKSRSMRPISLPERRPRKGLRAELLPRCWARPSSGTCRWAATASRPAVPVTSMPASTTGPGTSSTPTSWVEMAPSRSRDAIRM